MQTLQTAYTVLSDQHFCPVKLNKLYIDMHGHIQESLFAIQVYCPLKYVPGYTHRLKEYLPDTYKITYLTDHDTFFIINKNKAAQQIANAVDSCQTIDQLECCEFMANNYFRTKPKTDTKELTSFIMRKAKFLLSASL